MQKISVWKVIAGSFLALILGVIAPVSLAWATPMIGVAGTVLYAWAGFVPAALFALVGLLVSNLIGGSVFTGAFAVAVLCPAALAMWAVRKKLDYKTCMRVSVLGQVGAVVLALGLAWLAVRQNLVDLLVDGMTAMLGQSPTQWTDALLMSLGSMGLFGANASGVDIAKGYLSAAERAVLVSEYGTFIADTYKIGLAGMLLGGSVFTGVLNVALPVWIWARRGDERGAGKMPVSEWRVPANAAIGLPVCTAISYVLVWAGYPGGEAVLYAVWELFLLLLKFQCAGALSRMAKRSGMGPFACGFLIVFSLTTASSPAAIIGAGSLYLGSKGLITGFLRKKMKDQEGDQ